MLYCVARLANVDAFFCSMRVNLVCVAYGVFCFVLLVLLGWFIFYAVMVSSGQFVCIWCVLFILYLVLFCPSC